MWTQDTVITFFISRSYVIETGPSQISTPMANAGQDPFAWELPAFREEVLRSQEHSYALVIPVMNEGERIRQQLRRIRLHAPQVDIVIADGGSDDDALDLSILEETGVRAVLTKCGPGRLSAQLRMAYAWCLRQGYEGIVSMDGNDKDDVEGIDGMIRCLKDGCDYVQGSRYLPGGESRNTPVKRTIANRLIHAPILSIAGRRRFTDTTNGFRAYSAQYLRNPKVLPFRDIFVNYELLFYLTVRAGQIGLRVCHVPVRRVYPKGQPTPTKIAGIRSYYALLSQTINAALGRFSP